MTYEEAKILKEKAKSKKDGIYSFHGNLWAVKDREFVAFANPRGECYQRLGVFNYKIGTVKRCERKQSLIQWLKSI